MADQITLMGHKGELEVAKLRCFGLSGQNCQKS